MKKLRQGRFFFLSTLLLASLSLSLPMITSVPVYAGRPIAVPLLRGEEEVSYRSERGIMHFASFSEALNHYASQGTIKEIGPGDRPLISHERGVFIEPLDFFKRERVKKLNRVGNYFEGTYDQSVAHGFALDAAAMVMKNVPLFHWESEASQKALKKDHVPLIFDLSSDKQFSLQGRSDPRGVEDYENFGERKQKILQTEVFKILTRFTTGDGLVGTIYQRKCD